VKSLAVSYYVSANLKQTMKKRPNIMRTATFTFLFFLLTTLCYSQQQEKSFLLDKQVSALRDSLAKLNSNISNLTERQTWKNEILEERLKQASDTIANQNSLFDGFGVLYAIITIVITLIAIALPILTYQFGIKPSQKALKEFEANSEKKFETYLNKTRNKQIEQAIENIKSQNQELKNNAVSFLSLTQHQGFTDQQLYRIYVLLKSNEIDQMTKGTIAYTISNRKSDYATDYFTEALKDPMNINVKYAAIRYFANIGIEQYLSILKDLVANADDKNTEFNTIAVYVGQVNKNAIKVLLSNKPIIDLLDEAAIEKQKLTLPSFKTSWQLTDEEIEKSYLNERIKSLPTT
jgi:hypothetical protein